jgi:hypothetical protein
MLNAMKSLRLNVKNLPLKLWFSMVCIEVAEELCFSLSVQARFKDFLRLFPRTLLFDLFP